MKNKKGFTLIELVVVIVILGIIAAIAIPAFSSYIDKSKNAVLKTNCAGLVSFVQSSSLYFDKDHLFQNSRDSKTPDYTSRTYLSQYIEEYFETAGYGKNNFNLINPYSHKDGIINYSNYKLGTSYIQQAVVISNSSDLKYSATLTTENGKTYLMGSIIIYMANGSNNIELYYIDKDGKKSDTMHNIEVK